MTLHIAAKVLIQVWSYDFYDMTLSTGKQRRHMINIFSQVLTILSTVKEKIKHKSTCLFVCIEVQHPSKQFFSHVELLLPQS